MRFNVFAVLLALSCLPAEAQIRGPLLAQGSGATVSGFAHIRRGADGTYIELENSGHARTIAGFISFSNEPTFPGVMALDGRRVEITGMVVLYGRPLIMINAPEQLRVIPG